MEETTKEKNSLFFFSLIFFLNQFKNFLWQIYSINEGEFNYQEIINLSLMIMEI